VIRTCDSGFNKVCVKGPFAIETERKKEGRDEGTKGRRDEGKKERRKERRVHMTPLCETGESRDRD